MRKEKGGAEPGQDEASEFEPWFRNGDDSVVQPHRITTQSQYFHKNWVKVLGHGPSLLLMRLRMACYFNPATGEERDFCNPGLKTLAANLGVNERTVRRWLQALVSHDFVRKKRQNRWSEELGQWVQTTNKYRVKMWDPTVPEDEGKPFVHDIERMAEEAALEALRPSRSSTSPANGQIARSRKSWAVENSATGQNARSLSDRTECPSRRDTDLVTSNVNVGIDPARKQAAKNGDCTRQEALALELGERLKTWERGAARGDGFDGQPHQSERYHRLLAARMPEHLIRKALMAAADALQRGATTDPSAYFGGVIRKIAEKEGIDLGRSRKGPADEPRRPVAWQSSPGDTSGFNHDRQAQERPAGACDGVAAWDDEAAEARVALRELSEKAEAERSSG